MFSGMRQTRWKLLGAFGLIAAGCLAGWQIATWATNRIGVPANAIMVIAPYWYNGTWVFDDPAVGLNGGRMSHIPSSALRRATVVHRAVAAILLSALSTSRAYSQANGAPDRTVANGITTKHIVPGSPYELAGKRIVFTNWHYIQPGDLDWRDSTGKSVYVKGDEGPYSRAPRRDQCSAWHPHHG